MTLSIKTPSINDSITTLCLYAESRVLFIVMLVVVLLSAIMLSLVVLSVIMLSLVVLSVIMLSLVMMSVLMLSVVAPFKSTIKAHKSIPILNLS